MSKRKYKILIANSGKIDIKQKKIYILQQFRYRAYANNFSLKIKQATKSLETLPTSHMKIGFEYRGYDIYILPQSGHLLFYTVDEETKTVTILRILQDGMDWQYIIEQWLDENKYQ